MLISVKREVKATARDLYSTLPARADAIRGQELFANVPRARASPLGDNVTPRQTVMSEI